MAHAHLKLLKFLYFHRNGFPDPDYENELVKALRSLEIMKPARVADHRFEADTK